MNLLPRAVYPAFPVFKTLAFELYVLTIRGEVYAQLSVSLPRARL